jgi:hypothetical protein
MSHVEIIIDQFPELLPTDLLVGDSVTLTLKCQVNAIVEDLIDVTPLGARIPVVIPGRRVVQLRILDAEQPTRALALPETSGWPGEKS